MNFFSIDIGGSAVKYGLCTETGEITHKGSFPTPDQMKDLILALKQLKASIGGEMLAISSPGRVDCEKAVVSGFSAVPWFHDLPIRDIMKQELGMEAEIENDANCASLAELYLGSAKDLNDCCFVIFGTGIGGTLIHDRKIIRGSTNTAGEFGLLFSDFDSEDGSFTVWSHYSTIHTVFQAEDACGLKRGSLNGKLLFDNPDHNPVFTKVRDRFYRAAAAGMLNLQAAFDPEAIVIGGGISQREELLDEIVKKMEEMTEPWKQVVTLPTLRRCAFGNDANLIGAVVHAMNAKGMIG